MCVIFVAAGCAGPSDAPAKDPAVASTPVSTAGPTTRPHRAQCLVCKANADLAYLDVDVDASTPTYDYNGRTYYFCSKECRDEFAKNPTRYTPLAGK
jgi:YHS domain-containing protein